jgi:Ca2+-binding RTX toxin-like protein
MITIKKTRSDCNFCIYIIFMVLLSTSILYPLSSFAADLTGTDRDDTLYGTMADDLIEGKGGKDSLYGNGGADKVNGNVGDDLIQGDPGDDTLNGNEGSDMILGGSGLDKINGGEGDDYLEASFVIGSTSISDGKSDALTCGTGIDTAFINPLDGDAASADCEIVVSTP